MVPSLKRAAASTGLAAASTARARECVRIYRAFESKASYASLEQTPRKRGLSTLGAAVFSTIWKC
jgi:hypothetical protein